MNTADARREQRIHRFFEITLLLKALFAVGEIVAAIGVYVVPLDTGRRFCRGGYAAPSWRAHPHDLVAAHLSSWARNLSVGTQHFVAFYLLSHGAVKLWVIIGLMRERLWYYPVALVAVHAVHRLSDTPVHADAFGVAAADHGRSISS